MSYLIQLYSQFIHLIRYVVSLLHHSGLEPLPVKPCEGPEDLLRCISDLIIYENSGPAYEHGVVVNLEKGTAIHKVSRDTADKIAGIIILASKTYGVTISYLMACLCAESLFDPNCMNGNFLGSNKDKSAEGYDLGIAQLKLKYLIGTDGITNATEAHAYALDPAKAIPHCFRTMLGKLGDADEFIAAPHDDHSDFSSFSNRYYVATAMYNFGKTGFIAMDHHLPLSHCEIVKKYETAFANTLQEPSVFGKIL